MKKIAVLAFAFAMSYAGFSQNWSLDNSHAKLNFSVTHLLISDVEGNFKTINGKIVSSKEDFSDAQIEFTADVNSINTDNADRDAHLKTADFFDAAKYPTITFKSKSFKKVADKKYKLVGDLTAHGVTKQVEFDVIYNGTIVHPYSKKPVAGFKLTGTIKRSDFGIGTSTPSGVVSDEVTIVANTEFIKN